LLPTPRSGGGSPAGEAAGAATAGAFVCLAGLCLCAAGARLVAVTLIGGSGVAPEGAAGSAFCAHVAPTVARIAHTEPPRLNSLRADLNMLPQLDNNGTEGWIVISIKTELREPHDRSHVFALLLQAQLREKNSAKQMCTTDDFPEAL